MKKKKTEENDKEIKEKHFLNNSWHRMKSYCHENKIITARMLCTLWRENILILIMRRHKENFNFFFSSYFSFNFSSFLASFSLILNQKFPCSMQQFIGFIFSNVLTTIKLWILTHTCSLEACTNAACNMKWDREKKKKKKNGKAESIWKAVIVWLLIALPCNGFLLTEISMK